MLFLLLLLPAALDLTSGESRSMAYSSLFSSIVLPSLSQSVTQRLLTQKISFLPSCVDLLAKRTFCSVAGDPSLKTTWVTRSLHVFVVRAPSRCKRAMNGLDAEEPSKVKISTRAVTERRGWLGCGVIGYAAGVAPGALSGVFIGVRGGGCGVLGRALLEEGVCLRGFAREGVVLGVAACSTIWMVGCCEGVISLVRLLRRRSVLGSDRSTIIVLADLGVAL